MKQTDNEPAKKNYFFGACYEDLGKTIKTAFRLNSDTIENRRQKFRDSWHFGNIFRKISSLAMTGVSIPIIMVFGTLYTLVFSVFHVAFVFVFMLFFYIMFVLLWGIDRIILWKRKISHVCTVCEKSYLFPIYKCSCGRKHKRLAPGKYGILVRTCECGNKLPTSGFYKVNGLKRKDLPAKCPFCGHEDKQGESVQLVVPIGGGRSSGKSVFINAFVYDFAEHLAKEKGWDVDPINDAYDDKMKAKYKMITNFYKNGESRRTERQNDLTQSSVRDFSFWLRDSKRFTVPRLLHVLDIDGETFVEGSENFVPEHFRFSKGTILVIDPFWIQPFKNETYENLSLEDQRGIHSGTTLSEVISSFVGKLRGVLKLKSSQVIDIPVAVAISKIDSGNLEYKIGDAAVKKLMSASPDQYTEYYQTMDILCRRFLQKYGENNFLTTVENEFKNVRFFAFSALGHALREGEYRPKGVLPIMEWILTQGDAELKKTWNDHRF